MINYGATLDVAREQVWFVAGVLRTERRRRGTRRGRRALTPYWQAVLVLRWFRDATPVHRLATDHRISIAPPTATCTKRSPPWPPTPRTCTTSSPTGRPGVTPT